MQRKFSLSKDVIQFYTNKSILVTGGAGFIGSHFVDVLVNTCHATVTILDNFSRTSQAYIKEVRIINADIRDINPIKRACDNHEIVFHFAAQISVPYSIQNPIETYETNVMGTLNVLQAAHELGVERFFFASSAAVYGNQKTSCNETTTLNPLSPYGLSKSIGESLVTYYHKTTHLKCIIGRFFNVYGLRQQNGIWPAIKNSLETNTPMKFYGSGNQIRDFIPIEDVVTLSLGLVAQSPDEIVYNIATGTSLRIVDFFEQAKKQFPAYSQEPIFLPAQEGDISTSLADIARLKKVLFAKEHSRC